MGRPYLRFALTLLASLVAMLLISLEQVAELDHYLLNLSNLWISLTGIGAMGLIMFASMRGMFPDRTKNIATVAILVGILAGGFVFARTEALVGDAAFLDSMIPHHSRAILVCDASALTDPEILELCDQIVRAQSEEIRQMQDIQRRMRGG